MLEDAAFRIARDGVAKLVLHEGKPVIIAGKKHYEIKYDTSLPMKLLSAGDREKYGETKVIDLDLKDWDGDYRKLSEKSVRGLLEMLRRSCMPGSGRSGTRNCPATSQSAPGRREGKDCKGDYRAGGEAARLRLSTPSLSCRVMTTERTV